MTKTADIKTPYLIQRLLREDRQKTGVDAYFSFDYMGSSEFEFGTLPACLREIRALDFKSWEPQKMTVEHKGKKLVAWFVGPETMLPVAQTVFGNEITNRSLRFKEATQIAAVYGTDPWYQDAKNPPTFRVIGWWALDTDMSFAFFTKKEYAELWLKGLASK